MILQFLKTGKSFKWRDIYTQSSILALRIPMDKGSWLAIVHRVAELDTTQPSLHAHIKSGNCCSLEAMSDSLWSHGLQHTRLSCPSLSFRVCSGSCPLSWWCHKNVSSSITPFFSCPQSLSASGSFSNEEMYMIKWKRRGKKQIFHKEKC